MTYYQEHQSDFLEGLKTFLRIPSISTLSENISPTSGAPPNSPWTNCARRA